MEDCIVNAKANCYNLVNEAGWKASDLKEILKMKRYRFTINIDIIVEQMFVSALSFSKHNDYIDLIMARIERKNGKEFASRIFRKVLPYKDINELFDCCYEICSCNDIDLKEKALEMGMAVHLIKYYAKESKLGTLKHDDDRLKKRKENIIQNYPVACEVIYFLLDHDDKKEIIDFLTMYNGKYDHHRIATFASALLTDMSAEDIKIKVLRKYHYFVNYKRTVLNAPIERIDTSISKINEFVNGPYINYKSFLVINDLDKTMFETALNLAKVHDVKLYEEFKEKVMNIKSKKYPIKFLKLRKIALNIINGEYTILDYLKMTDYSVHDFYYIVEPGLTEEELMLLRKFYVKYRDMKLINTNNVKYLQKEINCKVDSKGFPIPGTGRLINEEEILLLLKQIKEDGYPLYEEVYNIYLKESLDKSKILQKIK